MLPAVVGTTGGTSVLGSESTAEELGMSHEGGLERTTDDAIGDPDELVGQGDERSQAAEAEQRLVGEGDPQQEGTDAEG